MQYQPQPSSLIPSDEQVLDLRQYIQIIFTYKYSILGLAFLFGIVGTLLVLSMTPIYSATATMLIEPDNSNIVSIEDVYNSSRNQTQYLNTQIQVMQSRHLANKVVERLSREAVPGFALNKADNVDENTADGQEQTNTRAGDSASLITATLDGLRKLLGNEQAVKPPGESAIAKKYQKENDATREYLISQLLSGLQVQPRIGSQLVMVSYTSTDPYLAATIANTVIDVYIENELDSRLEMTTKASNWLTDRLANLKEALRESEEKLQAFREQEKLVEVQGVTTLTAEQLSNLGDKLITAKQNTAISKASLDQVRSLKDKSLNSLLTIPVVLQDSLVSSFRQQESNALRNKKSLEKRYGPKHPKMKQAVAEYEESRAALQKRVNEVISGIEKEYQVARAKQRAVQSSVESTRSEMQSINRKSYELGVLEREVESNRQLYELFLNRFKETSETAGLDKTNARLSDPAIPNLTPVKPKKKQIILLATMAGLFFGVLLAFLREHLDNTFKKGADLETRLDIPLLGILPQLKLKKARGERPAESPVSYAMGNPKSFFAESMRTIRTGVMLSGLDNPHKVILVTSSVPGEGKSTTSMNLALSMSELNRVLLIDADMRRPTVATAWGLEKEAVGLSEFVSSDMALNECIHKLDEAREMYIMPAGQIPPNPLELLSSKRFASAISKLSETFDHIVIDSAPALAVSDSILLSTLASGVVYVVNAYETPVNAAQDGVKRLKERNAHIIGGVLNNVVESKKGGYGKYSYYGGDYIGSYGYTD